MEFSKVSPKATSVNRHARSQSPISGDEGTKLVSIDNWSLVKITANTMEYLAKFAELMIKEVDISFDLYKKQLKKSVTSPRGSDPDDVFLSHQRNLL